MQQVTQHLIVVFVPVRIEHLFAVAVDPANAFVVEIAGMMAKPIRVQHRIIAA